MIPHCRIALVDILNSVRCQLPVHAVLMHITQISVRSEHTEVLKVPVSLFKFWEFGNHFRYGWTFTLLGLFSSRSFKHSQPLVDILNVANHLVS